MASVNNLCLQHVITDVGISALEREAPQNNDQFSLQLVILHRILNYVEKDKLVSFPVTEQLQIIELVVYREAYFESRNERLKNIDNLNDMILWIAFVRNVISELLFLNFHSLDLILVVQLHC
jgi:hypothetical protein